jgi:hypothetical protein
VDHVDNHSSQTEPQGHTSTLCSHWATKEMKLNLDVAQVKRRIQIREVEKAYHKEEIQNQDFKGDKVLIHFNSRFKLFGKEKLQFTITALAELLLIIYKWKQLQALHRLECTCEFHHHGKNLPRGRCCTKNQMCMQSNE